MSQETFTFGEGDYEHLIGETKCPGCWQGYPMPCGVDGCSGLIHANFLEEDEDGYSLAHACDVCGAGPWSFS